MRRIVFDEQRVGPWVVDRVGGRFDSLSTAIGLEENERLIAGVLYNGCNKRSISAHIAGEGKSWMTRDFLHVIFDYPFRQLGVNVIIGTVDSENRAARHFDERLGFKLLSILPDAGPKADMCIYAIKANERRWLKLKDRYGESILKTR